jgi:hydrogenase maturation factor
MKFADAEAIRVFYAYAIGCFEIHETKGDLGKKEARNLIRMYGSGKDMPVRIDNYFPKAISRCADTAKQMGRSEMDAEVIREYFWYGHDRLVDQEALSTSMNPDYCKVWPGIVIELNGRRHAMVKTPQWKMNYRRDLVPEIEKGQNVTVHRKFIAEIIDKETAEELLRKKGLDENSLVL